MKAEHFTMPLQAITGHEFAAAPLAPAEAPTLADFEQYRITGNTPIPEPVPVITMAGATIADAQNIVVVSGESKSGKSALLGVMLAGAISQTGEIVDPFEGLQIAPNAEGRAVIHIDTEQARHKQQRNVRTIARRAGFDEYNTPAHYLSYNIREVALSEYQAVTDGICDAAVREFGGIHLLVIDGIADYIADVNSIEQSDEITRYFATLAIKYNMPILTVIHTNPGGIGEKKERGHLGSALQRKCQSLLRVLYDKSGDYSYLEPAFLRDAGRGQVPLVMFKFDNEKRYHVAIGERSANDKEAGKIEKEKTQARNIAAKVFAPPVALKYNDAKRKIAAVAGVSDSTAKRKLDFMTEWEMIVKGPDDHYRLGNAA